MTKKWHLSRTARAASG